MTDTTVYPGRSGKRRTSPRQRRPVNVRRRRGARGHNLAELALHAIMRDGDLYRVGRRVYLVAPVNAAILDTLIAASGADEDSEPNGDLEPSLGTENDLEGDGLEETGGRGCECSLGWADQGSQEHLTCNADESEPDLGWSNTGSQRTLSAGYTSGSTYEGDGECDDEDGDPAGDALDKGEHDNCDVEEDGRADLFSAGFAGSPLTFRC